MSLAIIPIDPAYMMLFGALFGVAALRNRKRALFAGLVAMTIFGVGVPVYCYVKNPAWMWGYWVNPATVPTWAAVAIFAAYYAFFALGFKIVPKRGAWWALGGVVALNLAALAVVIVAGRYNKVGTYEEFHRGLAVPLTTSSLGMILNIGGALTVEAAPLAVKKRLDVWGLPRRDWALMQVLKHRFDPQRVLNPGRFVGGL